MYIRKARQRLPLVRILIIVACAGFLLVLSKTSQADTVSWTSGEPSVVRTQQRKPVFDPHCELMLNPKIGGRTVSHLCAYKGKDVRFYQGMGVTGISIGSDIKVYLLRGSPFTTILPGTNTAFSNGGRFSIEKDMTGESYSGEPLELTQVIEVIGADPNDRDENGVNDITDKCLYIPAVNEDVDLDGTDDACDPEIGSPSQAYRVRSGRVANGEQAAHLFIERNIHAGSITGVTNDDDPNNDGWAIVGASQGAADSGRVANFWIDSDNVPHVSIRTPESGCVQYKPADLSRVTSTANRTLTREAVNTNTCRAKQPSADMDQDSVPDNIQPLYRVRNGDVAKGENPTKLYLERSTRAAEAQLGKSDYAPDSPDSLSGGTVADYRQPWSLLASSQNISTRGNFKKLIVVNDRPYILSTNLIPTLCLALKPTSLTTIKQSTQQTRGLKVDIIQSVLAQIRGACGR